MEVIEVNQVNRLLQHEVAEDRAKVRPRVTHVSERSPRQDPAHLCQRPSGPATGLARGDDAPPELRAQSMCVTAREIRSEDRDLERTVERSQELEGTQRTPRVRWKGDLGTTWRIFT